MFKNELYNQRIRFIIDSEPHDYFVDNLTITLRKVQKRRVLWDESVERFLSGIHLDFEINWQWFRAFPGTDIEDDIIFLYKELLNENEIIFVPNPEDNVKTEFTVRDSNDTFPIVDIRDKVRQGSFSLELETITMITDYSVLNPLGFEIV